MVRINQKTEVERELESLGQPRVFRARSQTDPQLFHYVIAFDDSRGIQCSCRGWLTHKNCWHVRAVPTELEPVEVDIEPNIPDALKSWVNGYGQVPEDVHITSFGVPGENKTLQDHFDEQPLPGEKQVVRTEGICDNPAEHPKHTWQHGAIIYECAGEGYKPTVREIGGL